MRRLAICAMFVVAMGCHDDADGSDDGDSKKGEAGDLKEGGASDIVFENVNVIPMTSDTVLEKQSVYVSKGEIMAVDSVEALSFPEDATVVDGSGKYLIPGLSDMHIHFSYPFCDEQLKLFLANGVTTVRNMWGWPELLSARDGIEAGDVLGPRMYTTGPLIDGPNIRWEGSFVLDAVDEVEAAITDMKALGYDYIKVYDDLSIDVYDEIIRVAQGLDIPVVGHVPLKVGVEHVIESGQFSIEHLTMYAMQDDSDLDEQIALTVTSGIWNCPTLIVLKSYDDLDAAKSSVASQLKYVAPDERSSWASSGSLPMSFSDRTALVGDLHREGANIVSGTDVGNPYVIAGFSLHTELALLQASGLTPYETLRTTTVNAAEMLGVGSRRGTVEPGKDADLVLLEDNPLEDIDATRSIAGVMIMGEWLPRERIQSMLDDVEDSFGGDEGTAERMNPTIDYGCFESLNGPGDYVWPSEEAPYRYCSEAVATGEAPVIADFEDCSSAILRNEGREGYFYDYHDGSAGTFTVDVESGALHITSADWTAWGVGFACGLGPLLDEPAYCSYDASRYAGIRFRAKGRGTIRLNVATVANVMVEEGGACDRGDNCYDWPGDPTMLTDDWQTVEIPFCAMSPEGWGGEAAPLDSGEIASLHFRMNAGQDVDFWLDDIAFFTVESAETPIACDPL